MAKWVKIRKVEERPDAELPNNIPVNAERIGLWVNAPKEGRCFIIRTGEMKCFVTSEVQEVLSETRFKTVNSIYEIERFEKEDVEI